MEPKEFEIKKTQFGHYATLFDGLIYISAEKPGKNETYRNFIERCSVMTRDAFQCLYSESGNIKKSSDGRLF